MKKKLPIIYQILALSIRFNFSAPNTIENLDLIESGVIAPNPAELLPNPRLSDLFSEIRKQYDYIVLDTAPVNLVTDTLIINEHVDMFVYVARSISLINTCWLCQIICTLKNA